MLRTFWGYRDYVQRLLRMPGSKILPRSFGVASFMDDVGAKLEPLIPESRSRDFSLIQYGKAGMDGSLRPQDAQPLHLFWFPHRALIKGFYVEPVELLTRSFNVRMAARCIKCNFKDCMSNSHPQPRIASALAPCACVLADARAFLLGCLAWYVLTSRVAGSLK